MNVATIQMDPGQAREKLKEYRGRKHRAADAEYQRVELAYEQLAKGTPLIILSDAIAAAPRDEKGRPRLAIARADRRQVHYSRSWDRVHQFDASSQRGGRPSAELTIRVPVATEGQSGYVSGWALIPMVPPAVIGNRALDTHFILWEVEAWADSRTGAKPDLDPYLLRRVDEDLFAVVAEWDLTDVERAVMRGRRDG